MTFKEETLIKVMKNYRLQKNMSIEQLSEAIDVPIKVIKDVEEKKIKLGISHLSAFIDYFIKNEMKEYSNFTMEINDLINDYEKSI